MAAPATLVGQVLDDVLFPAMAQIQSERQRVAVAYRRCVAGVALLTLPLSALALVLAPEIVRVLLGPRWADVTAPFRVLVLGTLFRTSYKISDSLTRALGAVYRRAWRQWSYAALVFGGGGGGTGAARTGRGGRSVVPVAWSGGQTATLEIARVDRGATRLRSHSRVGRGWGRSLLALALGVLYPFHSYVAGVNVSAGDGVVALVGLILVFQFAARTVPLPRYTVHAFLLGLIIISSLAINSLVPAR